MTDDKIKRTVQGNPSRPPLVILREGEEFILENKYYRNSDESIILRSTMVTGKLIKPVYNGEKGV